MLIRTILLGCGLLCSSGLPAWAGIVVLAWDFPLEAQSGAQYELHIVTLVNGQPSASDRLVVPISPEECLQWPVRQRQPETLCAPICLDPGDYSLSVRALGSWGASPYSNILDVDLSSVSPCTAPPNPLPSPSTPPPNQSTVASDAAKAATAAAAAAAIAATASQSSPSFPGMINPACVSWKIVGPCFCNPWTPCVTVEYWEPAYIVETVKRPGTTHLPLVGGILQAAWSALGIPPLGGGGAGNASAGTGHTNLQYNEAHVLTFPQWLGGPCTGCAPRNGLPTPNYLSELDPLWRTATAIPNPLDVIRVLGVWGRLYPRGGKAIHSSEPVGSGIAAARAMNIAFNPFGEPPNVEARVVLKRADTLTSCMQLASPRMTPCFPAGMPPPLWEHATVSPRGTYAWVMWAKRTCCVEPARASCGITLVGTHGANACLLPTPSFP